MDIKHKGGRAAAIALALCLLLCSGCGGVKVDIIQGVRLDIRFARRRTLVPPRSAERGTLLMLI